MATVSTVKEFGEIFEAYSQFEDNMLTAKIAAVEDESAEGEAALAVSAAESILYGDDGFTDADDMELHVARLEHLIERRPMLLNAVLLRQNPHNVVEWIKRAKLYEEKDPARVSTFFLQLLSHMKIFLTPSP